MDYTGCTVYIVHCSTEHTFELSRGTELASSAEVVSSIDEIIKFKVGKVIFSDNLPRGRAYTSCSEKENLFEKDHTNLSNCNIVD